MCAELKIESLISQNTNQPYKDMALNTRMYHEWTITSTKSNLYNDDNP